MSKLFEYFKKINNEKKLVQSYIIGNTKYDLIKEELNQVFESFFFNGENAYNIDIQILKNDEEKISKNEISDLLENIYKTSQFNNKKIYVIDECEKLNDSTYNALLKTLEEPPNGVYAFLITKNIDAVKSTIVSRCQKIFISNISEDINSEYYEIADEMISELEKNELSFIFKDYIFYNKIKDKNELYLILKIILNKYNQNLSISIDKDDNSHINKLCKKILIINDIISMLDYNLNKNLCLDRLVIEMWRCNNETSWN